MAALLMGLLSVGLFTVMVWGPLVFLSVPFVGFDRWLLYPQMRFLLYAFPPLSQQWPGPLDVFLTMEHRKFLGLLYGIVGWITGRFVFRLNDGRLQHLLWLLFCWGVWVGALAVFGGLMQMGK